MSVNYTDSPLMIFVNILVSVSTTTSFPRPKKRVVCLFTLGENIALYFAWVGFITQHLLLHSLVGVVVFIVQCRLDPEGAFEDPM